MGVSINGNSIVITNATIEIINGANPESGVSYIIITPEGGVGALPFMAQGLPGQPTLFDITLVQEPAGATLPSPNPVKTLIDPGGAGLPAKYALEFHINQGITGLTGSPSISGSSDFLHDGTAGAPALGSAVDGFQLTYRNSDGKFVLSAVKVGSDYVATSIGATASGNTSPRLLASIAIPAQPWNWRPLAFAQTVVTGTDGATPTRVDLVARVGDASTGNQVGFGKGLIGSNPAGIPTTLIPAALSGETNFGKVLTTDGGVSVHLRAEQKNSSTSNWATPASPDTTFWVRVQPLP